MSRRHAFVIATVVVLLAVAGGGRLTTHGLSTDAASLAELPVGGRNAESARGNSAAIYSPDRRSSRTQTKQNTATAAVPQGMRTAAAVFSDADMPMASRFAALAARADAGDRSARHLAYQMVLQCTADLVNPEDSTIELGAAQIRATRRLRDQCSGVLAVPAFSTYANMKGPRGVFDRDVAHAIKVAFADAGAQHALSVALGAIKARPDMWTIGMVGDTLESLGVSTIATRSLVTGNLAQLSASKRASLMGVALSLIACDFGLPCGPESHKVRYICAVSGVCMHGEPLVEIYRRGMLSRQDMRDVLILLERLRQIAPAEHDWASA